MRIKIETIGADGKQTKTVDIVETGASVNQICEKAGIDPKDKDFTVNGKPANGDTHVGRNDVLTAKGKPAVAVSARPQGS